MDNTYFNTYNLDWMYEYLTEANLNCSMIGDGYYMFKNDDVICFVNLGEKMHPNVDFRLAIDNQKAFNKIGQIPVSIDITEECKELVVKWVKYMGTKEGFMYSNSFEYLEDENRPCYNYSENNQ